MHSSSSSPSHFRILPLISFKTKQRSRLSFFLPHCLIVLEEEFPASCFLHQFIKSFREREMGDGECRPLGFLIGLPFAVIALVLSLVGAVIWVIGTVLSCLCPCCCCCAGLANFAVSLIKLPISILRWFIYQIPC